MGTHPAVNTGTVTNRLQCETFRKVLPRRGWGGVSVGAWWWGGHTEGQTRSPGSFDSSEGNCSERPMARWGEQGTDCKAVMTAPPFVSPAIVSPEFGCFQGSQHGESPNLAGH